MECQHIVENYLKEIGSYFECRQVDGKIVVITPYLYPDNDLIEIFIEKVSENRIRVGDLGETIRHLETEGFDVLGSKSNRYKVEQIASRVHVEIQRGMIVKEGKPEKIGELMFDVISAAKGIGDLIFLSRAYEPATFNEEVAKFLIEKSISFEPNYSINGVTGTKYIIDFRIVKPKIMLVNTLSPSKEAGMRRKVDAVFRIWSDINGEFDKDKKVSLVNDFEFQWKPHDLKLLERVSNIELWSKKEEIVKLLKSKRPD
jgi:hypothetical protein